MKYYSREYLNDSAVLCQTIIEIQFVLWV